MVESRNSLKSLKNKPIYWWRGSQNLKSVIKSKAEFFNIGSAVGSVWQRITIFERRGQFEAELGKNRFIHIRSRLLQGDPYAVFSMGDELSVLLGAFGEDDALEDQSPSCAAVHR